MDTRALLRKKRKSWLPGRKIHSIPQRSQNEGGGKSSSSRRNLNRSKKSTTSRQRPTASGCVCQKKGTEWSARQSNDLMYFIRKRGPEPVGSTKRKRFKVRSWPVKKGPVLQKNRREGVNRNFGKANWLKQRGEIFQTPKMRWAPPYRLKPKSAKGKPGKKRGGKRRSKRNEKTLVSSPGASPKFEITDLCRPNCGEQKEVNLQKDAEGWL